MNFDFLLKYGLLTMCGAFILQGCGGDVATENSKLKLLVDGKMLIEESNSGKKVYSSDHKNAKLLEKFELACEASSFLSYTTKISDPKNSQRISVNEANVRINNATSSSVESTTKSETKIAPITLTQLLVCTTSTGTNQAPGCSLEQRTSDSSQQQQYLLDLKSYLESQFSMKSSATFLTEYEYKIAEKRNKSSTKLTRRVSVTADKIVCVDSYIEN